MAVIAQRRSPGAFAGAEIALARSLGNPLQRLEVGHLVRTVAERLRLGAAAAAPPVSLALDDVDDDRFASANVRFAHAAPPPSVASQASPHPLASSRTRKI